MYTYFGDKDIKFSTYIKREENNKIENTARDYKNNKKVKVTDARGNLLF